MNEKVVIKEERKEVTAYDKVEKIVKAQSNTAGRVYVPKGWIGRKVVVLLLEPPSED